ncbi:MAG: hypothetical protein K2O86_01470 [Clostridia bacterium]|nr:hypothetical protein [Clostridia bacterium]
MKTNRIKIKKMKQDVVWSHVFYTLDDLYNGFIYDDKQFNKMLYDLLGYVEKKISPPDEAGDIVDKYLIVEYEELPSSHNALKNN